MWPVPARRLPRWLRDQLPHHPRLFRRADEALVEALVRVAELVRVDAELVEDGGLEVVHVHLAGGDAVAELVGFAEGDAGLDAAAGHEDRERVGVVVAAEEFAAVALLVERR